MSGKIRKFADEVGPNGVLAIEIAFAVWVIALAFAFDAKRYGVVALLLAPLVLGFVVGRVFRAYTSRKAAIRKARKRTRWPRLLKNTLKFAEGERVIYEKRMNPAVIIHDSVASQGWKLLIPVALVVVPVVASFHTVLPVALVALSVLIAVVVLCVQVAPATSNWWFTRRCFTNWRVIVVTGIIRKDFKAINRNEIRVPSHTEETAYNAVLRFFGLPEVWHWTFDTLVQDDPFKMLLWCHFLPPEDPSQEGSSPEGDLLEEHSRQTSDSLD